MLINTDQDVTFGTDKGFIAVQDSSTLVLQSADISLLGSRTITVQATVDTIDTVIGLQDQTVQFFVDLICVVYPVVPASLTPVTVSFN